MRSQKVVAQYLEENGFPWAESTGSGRSGVDITGVPGLAIEVKARAKLEPQAWLRQAEREDAGMPVVIFRLNGVGEANVGSWGVMQRLDVWTQLVREAGYGSPMEPVNEAESESDDDEGGNARPEDVERRQTNPLAKGVSSLAHEPESRG